ncbi:GntR family transcriptional regulator [Anaerosphaera multitolerans]|uniref:GntR family transcriptional regulator n=1 Tax=Anaerosphaera multitolerans TaxID=2487351 RepID=A0A437S6L7_9FIRM|nr:GntR family transcriptional regulator [Anaerosphaera multitolerans]RVU54663.1 GntR family transcriptional regulator [Anaerosphaera multitolerans]
MTNLKPIKLLPAREQIASVLRKQILSRNIKEGETISLEATAKKLGVSVTPVREALYILDSNGLVKLRPNKEALVMGVTPKTIRDHYEIRAILEREAAVMVCENKADLSDVVAAYNGGVEVIKNNKAKDYGAYNQAFHVAIWKASGNERMESLLSSMWNGLSMGDNVTKEEYAKTSISEHKDILNALENRDRELARTLMSNHIFRSMENILTHFK